MMVLMMATAALAQSSDTASDDDDAHLDLDQWTYEAGGFATANIGLVDIDDDGVNDTDVYLLISPQFGVFVVERGEVYVKLDMLVDEVDGFNVGIRGGFDYFLKGEWVAPYFGIGVGYGTRQLDDAPQSYTQEGVFTVLGRTGMLLPVSDTVAIDLGAEVNYNIANDKQWWTIPLGVAGVRAFFK